MDNYPPSMTEVPLFHRDTLLLLRGRRSIVLGGFMEKVRRRLGFRPSRLPGRSVLTYHEKAGTALVVYKRGVPVLRGSGGSAPEVVDDLIGLWHAHLKSVGIDG